MPNDKPVSQQTLLSHDLRHEKGAVTPPIYQSSPFTFSDYDSMIARFRGELDQPLYSRVDTPTVRALQEKAAALDSGEACLAFGSGMASFSNAILIVLQPGAPVV